MKTGRLCLATLVGTIAVIGLLALLSWNGTVTAEWIGNWYWKDGAWLDYAPSGLPDFDQKQDNWNNPPGSGPWTFCGPVAAANSIWWFDSKFEPSPVWPMSLPPNDNYFLVTSYAPPGGYDDHDPLNVGGIGPPGLVDDLAWYFDTDGIRTGIVHTGTEVHDMAIGLQWYLYGGNPAWGPSPVGLRQGSYYDDYHVQLVKRPAWEWVVDEVLRSEDVILLLGFWQEQPDGSGYWVRVGGHYVTVAGINSTDLEIAFSDPFWDSAESGGAGRVLSGTIFPHTPGHPASIHNDAGNVSHDAYSVTLAAISPGGAWEIANYLYPVGDFGEQNCPGEYVPDQGPFDPTGGPIMTEVEYALAMSPLKWKPGGEWVHTFFGGEWIWEWWWYEDDGHSCLPDFAWGGGEPFYDGPTVLANSFWWFDSKAETLVTGGWPTPPPTVSDHYGLVQAYGEWDDHAITNTMPFIADLAAHLSTTPEGTAHEDMAAGIDTYLSTHNAVSDFYTLTQNAPSFAWVADEVETCEDVIMLLGFYEDLGGSNWERKGGHWVNAAGVNREGAFVALSDPVIDWANVESFFDVVYTGRVFPPEQLGTPFSTDEKRDPQAISHDIYAAAASPVPEYQWALTGYPATTLITDFVGLNEGGFPWMGQPISTVVEWAIGVSPYSDLIITKTAMVTDVVPGKPITYVVEYANIGLAAADDVTITDLLPLSYMDAVSYTATPPIHARPNVTYVWTLPRLSYGQRGLITITGKALQETMLTNTATITGLSAIGKPTPDRDPSNNFALTPEPTWYKEIEGIPWYEGISVTVQTSDTLRVSEGISSYHPITLSERWDPDHLVLLEATLLPPEAGTVISGDGWLELIVYPGQSADLTKLFAVQPCTWTQSVLEEALSVEDGVVERRPVLIQKMEADLWIDSDYEQEIDAGGAVSFTLRYGNRGGYENGVAIRNEFPVEAPFASSVPSATHAALDGSWAEWDVGGLANAYQDTIVVTVTVSGELASGNWITITDWISNHLGAEADVVATTFHVTRTRVTGVSLSMTNTGTIYTDTVVYLSADIASDNATKPYTYSVDYDDGTTLVTGTSSDDPLILTHIFPTTGTHAVQLGVWNCDMGEHESVTSTVDVTVSAYRWYIYLPVVMCNYP